MDVVNNNEIMYVKCTLLALILVIIKRCQEKKVRRKKILHRALEMSRVPELHLQCGEIISDGDWFYSSNIIRKTQNEHLNIVCQNLICL